MKYLLWSIVEELSDSMEAGYLAPDSLKRFVKWLARILEPDTD